MNDVPHDPEIDRARRDYFQQRARLLAYLDVVDDDYMEILIEHLGEFGPDKTLELMGEDPLGFGLQMEGRDAGEVREWLSKLSAAQMELETMSARRDTLGFLKGDHRKVYVVDGRDCVLDEKANAMTYLDTNESVPFRVIVVEPTREPDRNLVEAERSLDTSKKKRRDKSL